MGFRRAKFTQRNTNLQKNIFVDDRLRGHHPRALKRYRSDYCLIIGCRQDIAKILSDLNQRYLVTSGQARVSRISRIRVYTIRTSSKHNGTPSTAALPQLSTWSKFDEILETFQVGENRNCILLFFLTLTLSLSLSLSLFVCLSVSFSFSSLSDLHLSFSPPAKSEKVLRS